MVQKIEHRKQGATLKVSFARKNVNDASLSSQNNRPDADASSSEAIFVTLV